MNKVMLMGRLTSDPDIKYTGDDNKAVANFSLAISRKFKNKDGKYDADFINCKAFGKVAEIIEKYFHKGSMMLVEGEWRTGSYESKDGKKIYTNECFVNGVEFTQSKKEAEADSSTTTKQTKEKKSEKSAPKTNTEDDFMPVPDAEDDDIPFF